MFKKCTDIAIGARLAMLGYAFSKSPARLQEIYYRHLLKCSYCSRQVKKADAQSKLNHELVDAIFKGDTPKARSLLKKGAQTNIADRNGLPILIRAAGLGYKDLVKLLLDKGADVNTSDSKLRTALYWAAKFGHKDVVELLLKKGAHIEPSGFYERSPEFVALLSGHQEIVDLLAKYGADINAARSRFVPYTRRPSQEFGVTFCKVAFIIMQNAMECESLYQMKKEITSRPIFQSVATITTMILDALQFLIDGDWVRLANVDSITGQDRPVPKSELKALLENPALFERPVDINKDLLVILIPTDEGCAHWIEDNFSIVELDLKVQKDLVFGEGSGRISLATSE